MKKTLSLVIAVIMVLTIFVSVPVVASAATVTEITYTPAEPIVFWYGYETNLRQFSTDYLKQKITPVGSFITFHYSDGTTENFVYDGYEYRSKETNSIIFGSSVSIDTYYQYNWSIGTDNFVIVNVGRSNATPVQVPVTVIEHPVKSIELVYEKSIEFYENLGGQLVTNTSVPYYKYTADVFDFVINKHTRLVVNYKDGTKSSYVYNPNVSAGLIDAHGNKIDAKDLKVDTKQDQIHWTLGSNNYCEISYKNISTNVPVTILETPVESISYTLSKPIELYENVDGLYDSYYNNFVYTYDYTTDAILTVNYKDGRTIPYYEKEIIVNNYEDMLGSRFFDEWGNMLPDIGYPSVISQNYGAKKWSKGTQYFTVTYKGATCDVPVTIVENPFSAMKVNLVDCCIYERNVEGHRPYLFSLESHGNSVTFTYKTGGTVTYTYDGSKLGWFDQYGNEFKHRISWEQYDDNWTTGQTYPVTVSFGDLSDTVYVTTVSNPIVSVDAVLSKPIVVYENVNCSWNEELSCLKYNLNDLLPDGTAIIFTYANGTSKTYYYDKENRWLEDSNGVRINDYTLYRFYLAQDNAFTLGNNYMFLEISQTSLRCAVPVTLKPQTEAPPYRLEFVDGKWVCMSGDTKAGYYTGLVEHNGGWYYVSYGNVYWYYTGLCEYQGYFYYVKNGCVDWYYTSLVNHNNDFCYVENGVLNWNKTGLVYCWDEWYYVENGWFNPYATTLVYCNDQWYYVENGEINWNSQTLCCYEGTWYYVENGVVNWAYTGLAQYCGDWYYVNNGWVNWNYTGLTQYNGVWYYVENSYLDWSKTTLTNYNGYWYYVENGEVNWNSDTLVNYEGYWYYTYGGGIAWDYIGLVQYNGDWYYVKNGGLDWSYTGLVQYNGDWYHVVNGYLDWNYSGVTEYEGYTYYVSGGYLDWSYNGDVEYDGKNYTVVNGVATLVEEVA